MSIRWSILPTVALLAVAPLGLRADDGPGDRPPGLAALDANGDGQVVRDEVPEDRRQLFDRLLGRADENKDGQLSLDELKVAFRDRDEGRGPDDRGPGDRRREDRRRRDDRPGDGNRPERPRGDGPRGDRPMPPPSPLLKALDTNHDGRLSADEIAAASESLKKLDRDDDGEISPREFFMAMRDAGPGPRPDGPPPGGPRPDGGGPDGPRPDGPGPDGPGPRGPQGDRARAFLERLKEADQDGDRRLSREEAPERMRERFDRIDENRDGYIDMEEIHVMFQRVMAARGPEAGPDRPKKKPEADPDKAKKKGKKDGKKKDKKNKDPEKSQAEGDAPAADTSGDPSTAANREAAAPL